MSTVRPSWNNRELPGFFLTWRSEWQQSDLLLDNYLDHQGGLPFVVAASWLFCPETVEYRGCTFLKDRFDKTNVDDWFTNLAGFTERIEATVNHLELWGAFANTDLGGENQLGKELPQLALAIGECWQGILSARYPDRTITVEVSDEEDGAYGPTITFWTETVSDTAPVRNGH
jgi:hypothetical protein